MKTLALLLITPNCTHFPGEVFRTDCNLLHLLCTFGIQHHGGWASFHPGSKLKKSFSDTFVLILCENQSDQRKMSKSKIFSGCFVSMSQSFPGPRLPWIATLQHFLRSRLMGTDLEELWSSAKPTPWHPSARARSCKEQHWLAHRQRCTKHDFA